MTFLGPTEIIVTEDEFHLSRYIISYSERIM
jgi:hypothetical protein